MAHKKIHNAAGRARDYAAWKRADDEAWRKKGGRPQGLPPAPPPAPAIPPLLQQGNPIPLPQQGNPELVAVLEQALASLPQAPSLQQVLAPIAAQFGAMEGRVNQSHQAALPAIANAYLALRNSLGQSQQTFDAEAARVAQASQGQMQQAQGEVSNLQSQVLRDLQTQGGGMPALGSLTAAAQAEANNNVATMKLGAEQARARDAALRQTMLAQYQDRNMAANQGETSARTLADTNKNRLLNELTAKRMQAEMQAQAQYDEMVNSLAEKRSALGIDIAKAKSAGRMSPLEQAEYQLRGAEHQLKAREMSRDLGDPIPAVVRRYDQRHPNSAAVDFFMSLGDAKDAGEAIKVIDAKAAENGGKFIKHRGKRLDPNTLKSWVREAAR